MFFYDLITSVIVEETICAGQGNTIHSVVKRADLIVAIACFPQLRPAPFSYLCVGVRILGVLKIVCCCENKT